MVQIEFATSDLETLIRNIAKRETELSDEDLKPFRTHFKLLFEYNFEDLQKAFNPTQEYDSILADAIRELHAQNTQTIFSDHLKQTFFLHFKLMKEIAFGDPGITEKETELGKLFNNPF